MPTATIETPSVDQVMSQFRRGITKTPGVCGGAACIANTRIPVWLLEESRRIGLTETKLLDSYPTLQAADLVNAWAFTWPQIPLKLTKSSSEQRGVIVSATLRG